MYTKTQLKEQLRALGIDARGTLLVHSSLRAIGAVAGGADAVLDALSEYMAEGLLIFPTHTWRQMGPSYTVFDAETEPSCVGALTELFRKRPGAIRSLHPTHSVAALGRDAAEYVSGEENARTPCPRSGCWGKLYDRRAQILFLGCTLKSNTFLHGVEEWNAIPNRLAREAAAFTVIAPGGARYAVPQYRHHADIPGGDVSAHYDKMEPAFARAGAISYGSFGDARCILGDAVRMADITAQFLQGNPRLFDDDTPLPENMD